jgi:hypothetical protein
VKAMLMILVYLLAGYVLLQMAYLAVIGMLGSAVIVYARLVPKDAEQVGRRKSGVRQLTNLCALLPGSSQR